MMKLSEIDDAEYKKRDKAWRYEKLANEADRLRRSVKHLTGLQKSGADPLKTLEQMQELCGQLPKDLMSTGTRFVAGGFVLRDLLQVIVVGALGDVQRKRQAASVALKTTQQKLVEVEAALKEFAAAD